MALLAESSNNLAAKVVATDIDGTLCLSAKYHPTTPAAISKLQKEKILTIPVTGRSPLLAKKVLDNIGLATYPGGYHHGAYTLDAEGVIVIDERVPFVAVQCLVEAAKRMHKERSIECCVMAQSRESRFAVYRTPGCDEDIFEKRWLMSVMSNDGNIIDGHERKDDEGLWTRVAGLEDMNECDKNGLYQATIVNIDEHVANTMDWQVETIRSTFADLNVTCCKTHTSGRCFIDTIHKDADKSHAIKAICSKYNFDMSQVVAIGDNHNDVGMLVQAGTSIAMGNAQEKVKQKANHITGTVMEGGWASAIDKFVFNQ